MKNRVVESRVRNTTNSDSRQRTLKSSIGCCGIGLHSGTKVAMTLHPGEPGTGIVFRRTDRAADGALIEASWRNVVDSRMATTLANDDDVRVSTVEHLMAALSGCGIDNAVIDIDGPELPIMDGSAAPFVFLVECAGTVAQDAPQRTIRILKPVTVGEHSKSISLRPSDEFSVSFEIEYDNTLISRQELGVQLVNGTFKSDIARARTFGFEHEVAQLLDAGLARGGSLDNAIVVSGDTVLNVDGLRYDDEFVRHKILDCIGDMYLAGAPIQGHVHGVQSGHALNLRVLEALFDDDEAWDYVERGPAHHVVGPGDFRQDARLAIA